MTETPQGTNPAGGRGGPYQPVVERLTGHESRRATRGGANTTGSTCPPIVLSRRDRGFAEPGSVRLHHPCRGGFLDRHSTGGVRAATFLATTPRSREALDHRLLAPTASGVALSPGCSHVDNRLRELDLVQRSTTWCPVGL